jgi:hypothetical protein
MITSIRYSQRAPGQEPKGPRPAPHALLLRWTHVIDQEATNMPGDGRSVLFQREVPRIDEMRLDGL